MFFWNTFGTSLELAWNFGGTFTLDCEVVIRFCGTCVELWWNFGGTFVELAWNFFGYLEEKSTYRFTFLGFLKSLNP